MSQIEIIGFDASTYVRTTRLFCEEKGIAYTLNPAHLTGPQDLSSAIHLAFHPYGRIPVMRHGDVVIFETSAICRYLEATFGGPRLFPESAVDAARAEQWASALHCYFNPVVVRRYILEYAFPKGEDGQPRRDAIDAALPDVRDQLQIVNEALTDGPYFLGETIMLADLVLLPMVDYVAVMPEGDALLAAASNVRRFRDTFSKRASYSATLPERLKNAA